LGEAEGDVAQAEEQCSELIQPLLPACISFIHKHLQARVLFFLEVA